MRILLTNDDGIMADGIYQLAKALEKDYQITIVAPHVERSAQSQAISLFEPMILQEVTLRDLKSKAYSLSGTPTDCVRVALDQLVEGPIDLLISGINKGYNAGMDVLYSGTVAAAMEGNLQGLPALALSTEYMGDETDFSSAVEYSMEILASYKEKLLKDKLLLSVNIPFLNGKEARGIKVCKLGKPIYDFYSMDEYGKDEKIINLRGRQETEFDKDCDRYYLSQSYITVSPLQLDLTDQRILKELKEI